MIIAALALSAIIGCGIWIANKYGNPTRATRCIKQENQEPNMDGIPTASEARKQVDACNYHRAKHQKERIKKEIEEAICNGRKDCRVEGYVDDEVMSQLRSIGYKVLETHNGTGQIYLSWK